MLSSVQLYRATNADSLSCSHRNVKFFTYQFAKWPDLVYLGKGGRCCWVWVERNKFFHHPTPHSDQNQTAERNGERALQIHVLSFAYFLNTDCSQNIFIWDFMHMFLCTCFWSRFCASFRSVMLCTPCRSLSSKMARARVKLDPGVMHVHPDSRLTASYSHAFTNNIENCNV